MYMYVHPNLLIRNSLVRARPSSSLFFGGQTRPSTFLRLELVSISWRIPFNDFVVAESIKPNCFNTSSHIHIPSALSQRGTLSSETLAKKLRNWAFETLSFLSIHFFSPGWGVVGGIVKLRMHWRTE